VGWIFFRANSVSDAVGILVTLGNGWGEALTAQGVEQFFELVGNSSTELGLSVLGIGVVLGAEVLAGEGNVSQLLERWHVLARWPVYVALTLMIFNLGVIEEVPFIYFQF